MIRRDYDYSFGSGRLPRTRGDDPKMLDLTDQRVPFAPHARG